MLSLTLPRALLLAFAISQVANLATTLYLHRTLSHRAITMHPVVEWLCRFMLWITVGIDRREWVSVHRKHHVFNDEPDDPHSPRQKGVGQGPVPQRRLLPHRGQAGSHDRGAYGRDIPDDRWERLLFGHGLLGRRCSAVVLLTLLFGPWWALFIGFVHAGLYILQGGHGELPRPPPSAAVPIPTRPPTCAGWRC